MAPKKNSTNSQNGQPNGKLTIKDFPMNYDKFRTFPASPDDEIVISGMAGRFPESDNVAELAHNLYNKV